MIRKLFALLRWRRGKAPADDLAAQRARRDADHKLAAAQGMWKQTRWAHDKLAEMIDAAMRGNR